MEWHPDTSRAVNWYSVDKVIETIDNQLFIIQNAT